MRYKLLWVLFFWGSQMANLAELNQRFNNYSLLKTFGWEWTFSMWKTLQIPKTTFSKYLTVIWTLATPQTNELALHSESKTTIAHSRINVRFGCVRSYCITYSPPLGVPLCTVQQAACTGTASWKLRTLIQVWYGSKLTRGALKDRTPPPKPTLPLHHCWRTNTPLLQFCPSHTDFLHHSVQQTDRGDAAPLLWCLQMRLSASLRGQLDWPKGWRIARFQSLQGHW